jgi:hypothetical protein
LKSTLLIDAVLDFKVTSLQPPLSPAVEVCVLQVESAEEQRRQQKRQLHAWRLERKAAAEQLEGERVAAEAEAAEQRRKLRVAKMKEAKAKAAAAEQDARRQRDTAMLEARWVLHPSHLETPLRASPRVFAQAERLTKSELNERSCLCGAQRSNRSARNAPGTCWFASLSPLRGFRPASSATLRAPAGLRRSLH